MYKNCFKRVIGLVLAIIAFPLFLLAACPIAISILIEDGRPIFYKGSRLGKGMHEFKMIKFRSMIVDAPDIRNEDGSTFNAEDDPRLTRVGKFIRKTSLDELPQLLNIIVGDMAWIGPRPSPLGNIDKYPCFYLKKFDVAPGLTGYTQAKFRNRATMDERMENDVYYVDNISFFLDLKIVFWTIKTVLLREGVYRDK